MRADGKEQGDAVGSTSSYVAENRLTLLPDGPGRLAALLHLIETAERRLDLYYYTFVADAVGQRIADALVVACKRGVAVTLMVDAFGSAFTPHKLVEPLVAAGGRFGRFGDRRSTRYLIRNHQKMAIADGARVLIGGFNCELGYFAPDDDPDGWRDLALLVEGPLCPQLAQWYEGLAAWTLDSRQGFRALRRLVRDWRPGIGPAIWLMGGPTRHLNSWARRVKLDLQAGSRLDMIAAYFSPGPGMLRRMGKIAQRGFARLILPMRSDNKATIGAARYLYRRLLRRGLALFEFQPQKLHVKLLVVDDAVYVGSANFDKRSLFINLELMLRIEDAAFARSVRGLIDELEARSRPIDKKLYAQMAGPFARLRWWFDHFLVGVLDYTVTRRLNFRRRR